VERFNPVLDSLAEVPGQPRFIEVQRLAGYPPPRPGLPPRGTEVSVVLDLMIHDIDVVLDLVGSAVKKIDAVGVSILSPTEDIANVRLLFENGCVANLTASRGSQECLRKIRVFKPTAYLSLDYQEQCGEIAGIADGQVWRRAVPVHPRNALQVELQDFCQSIAGSRGQDRRREPRVSGVAGLAALKVAEQIIAEIAAGA
jgi:predicted dehydrogenase